MSDKELFVYLNNEHIGVLSQDSNGKLNFTYNTDAKSSLSMSLPLRKEKFGEKECFGYFDGLLPESDHSRKFLGQKYGINANNDFSLLRAIGHDCAGAVSFYQKDEKVLNIKSSLPKGEPITAKDLALNIKNLPSKPLFMDIKDFRLSLAGVQDKASISIINGQICIPKDNTPTTHILKPSIAALEGSIENEYICMKAASKIGIEVPEVSIGFAEDEKYLLIKRYDRKTDENGHIARMHQEDFCQAFAVASAYKYQSSGGVGFIDCFTLLRRLTMPAVEINKFVNVMIFNFLIGNNDAHGKNFSVLYDGGNIKFAPAYDILCTQAYLKLTKKMAMSVAGYYNIDEILPRHWEKLCGEIKFAFPQMKKLIIGQCEKLPEIIKNEIDDLKNLGITNSVSEKIYEFTALHCQNVLKEFRAG